jgi:hypothetical protein
MKMLTDETYRLFLLEAVQAIKERALEARSDRPEQGADPSGHLFQSGRLLGFNEVISIIQQYADGFQIDLAELQLDDIEPDKDLI